MNPLFLRHREDPIDLDNITWRLQDRRFTVEGQVEDQKFKIEDCNREIEELYAQGKNMSERRMDQHVMQQLAFKILLLKNKRKMLSEMNAAAFVILQRLDTALANVELLRVKLDLARDIMETKTAMDEILKSSNLKNINELNRDIDKLLARSEKMFVSDTKKTLKEQETDSKVELQNIMSELGAGDNPHPVPVLRTAVLRSSVKDRLSDDLDDREKDI